MRLEQFQGNSWVADVLAVKGERRIAFEVQVSPQQFMFYRIRQQRYRGAGVKCVWLSSALADVSDQEVPVFGL